MNTPQPIPSYLGLSSFLKIGPKILWTDCCFSCLFWQPVSCLWVCTIMKYYSFGVSVRLSLQKGICCESSCILHHHPGSGSIVASNSRACIQQSIPLRTLAQKIRLNNPRCHTKGILCVREISRLSQDSRQASGTLLRRIANSQRERLTHTGRVLNRNGCKEVQQNTQTIGSLTEQGMVL